MHNKACWKKDSMNEPKPLKAKSLSARYLHRQQYQNPMNPKQYLTHFSPMFHFYNPSGFLTFLYTLWFSDVFRGIEIKHWAKMG